MNREDKIEEFKKAISNACTDGLEKFFRIFADTVADVTGLIIDIDVTIPPGAIRFTVRAPKQGEEHNAK